jgi:hypothetical protein
MADTIPERVRVTGYRSDVRDRTKLMPVGTVCMVDRAQPPHVYAIDPQTGLRQHIGDSAGQSPHLFEAVGDEGAASPARSGVTGATGGIGSLGRFAPVGIPHDAAPTRLVRHLKPTAPGWIAVAVCRKCGHMAALPYDRLRVRFGESFPADEAMARVRCSECDSPNPDARHLRLCDPGCARQRG